MKKKSVQFASGQVDFYFDGKFSDLKTLTGQPHTVLITDENVFQANEKKFKGWNTIVLNAGEQFKVQQTVNEIIEQLIDFGADRKTWLVGIGGGVITDLTGYVAAIYMRGIRCGFIPTSILAMVDASIGGKNGIDIGVYKNLAGTIRQPQFLLYDYQFLKSLPQQEWINGFAEIIKHACIKDVRMFNELSANDIAFYQKNKKALSELIRKNAGIKIKVVKNDEFEHGERRLLNFGHTLGHAIENLYELSHGQAIAVGMVEASKLSQKIRGFKQTGKVVKILEQYGLPTTLPYDKEKALEVLKMDKKRERAAMNYILLDKIGKGIVESIPMQHLSQMIQEL
jgi:3-dehydroquinate synthase